MDCFLLADSLNLLITSLATSVTDFAGVLPLAQADVDGEGISWSQYAAVAIALAVMILPFIVGGFLAKKSRMPDYGTRFGFIILAIVASAVVLSIPRGSENERRRGPGLGVDLRGGTILVYEIDPSKNRQQDGTGKLVVAKDLIDSLSDRINPSGTREIVIRPYGDTQIEIIVPEVDQHEVDRIKQLVAEAGILRFAIVANRRQHQRLIDLAVEQSKSAMPAIRTQEDLLDVDGRVVGRWVLVDREKEPPPNSKIKPLRLNVGDAVVRNPDTGAIIDLPFDVRGEKGEFKQARWIDEQGLPGLETLVIIEEGLDVIGEDLAFTNSTFDQNGSPAVAFTLTDEGSGKFFALTTNNAPVGTSQSQLGIVLDDKLLSAPNILQPIRKEGRITGNFTREEVDHLVQILKAGQLPAALTEQPIAENQIDATLGADTIRKGVIAIGTSLLLVLIFILIYYRFAGVIACIALVLNLAMILATMVLINQPLTLPGLAGLVLTVGMSVDANVLIFERIREELKKGAAARMAVRNGFAKATVTIVDANLTTLITAIVLYAIGTDQIRGFAVTLILGILFSMFTAIYMSRTFFDFAERHGLLTLSMSDGVNRLRQMVSGEGTLDFVSMGRLSLALSAILVVVGIGSLFARGKGILDIDFAGGSSVQFRLDTAQETDDIRRIVETVMVDDEGNPIQFTVNGVSMEEAPENTVYKVDSSFESVEQLQAAIVKAFEAEGSVGLMTYQVNLSAAEPSTTSQSLFAKPNGVMLTALHPQDEAAEAEPADAEPATAAEPEEAAETAQPPAAADAETAAPSQPPADTPTATTPAATDAAEPAADDAAATEPATAGPAVTAAPSAELWYAVIEMGVEGDATAATISEGALTESLEQAASKIGLPLNTRLIDFQPEGEGAEDWKSGSSVPFTKWKIGLPVSPQAGGQLMEAVKQKLGSDPVWISSSSVGSRVAGDMIGRALGALFASLLCIIGYIWFRFQRVIYGFAAVAALLHDVCITLGAIAVSYWLADALGWMLIDPFKISLTVVAALLTIIGYSLNDTIVVFDRIRETKGKAPRLTGEMINVSINQTLSRTLLTSVTTLIVVVLLYAFGGEGIHAFAFALVIGVLVGTYSSIFVASPILLMLIERNERKTAAA
jgi:SecD/SecF fusion protein